MGLLRRNPRPSLPPGDWLDALQAAMWVDPSIRPKREPRPDDPPPDADDDDEQDDAPPPRLTRMEGEVPRRFRPRPADPTPDAAKPWLPPVAAPPAQPSADPAAAPAAVEQLLQWVCRLSRMRRAGPTTFAADTLRADADRLLAAVARGGPVGVRLRPALAGFVDVVMLAGGLPITGPWRPLGPTPPGPTYRAAAEAAAADPTGLHDGIWAAHHAALSLVADLVPDGPAVLHALDAKLHGTEAVSADDHICPAAYEGVFDHAIVRPAARPVRAVAAAAVGLLLLSVAGAVLLNVRYVGQLRTSVDAVDRALREPSGKAATNGTNEHE